MHEAKKEKQSVAAEIAVACAGIPPDDYYGLIKEIKSVLDRFGIDHVQRPRK